MRDLYPLLARNRAIIIPKTVLPTPVGAIMEKLFPRKTLRAQVL